MNHLNLLASISYKKSRRSLSNVTRYFCGIYYLARSDAQVRCSSLFKAKALSILTFCIFGVGSVFPQASVVVNGTSVSNPGDTSPFTVNGGLEVGSAAAPGSIFVSSGGQLITNGLVDIGYSSSNSEVNVSGVGSKWSANTNVEVGRAGLGSMNILNGAEFVGTSVRLANLKPGDGNVLIDGQGTSAIISGSLTIGGGG
jgi:T5SS/PEP-CTERM-associated repeat protein